MCIGRLIFVTTIRVLHISDKYIIPLISPDQLIRYSAFLRVFCRSLARFRCVCVLLLFFNKLSFQNSFFARLVSRGQPFVAELCSERSLIVPVIAGGNRDEKSRIQESVGRQTRISPGYRAQSRRYELVPRDFSLRRAIPAMEIESLR